MAYEASAFLKGYTEVLIKINGDSRRAGFGFSEAYPLAPGKTRSQQKVIANGLAVFRARCLPEDCTIVEAIARQTDTPNLTYRGNAEPLEGTWPPDGVTATPGNVSMVGGVGNFTFAAGSPLTFNSPGTGPVFRVEGAAGAHIERVFACMPDGFVNQGAAAGLPAGTAWLTGDAPAAEADPSDAVNNWWLNWPDFFEYWKTHGVIVVENNDSRKITGKEPATWPFVMDTIADVYYQYIGGRKVGAPFKKYVGKSPAA